MSRSDSAADLSMEDILASIRSLVPADQRGEPEPSRAAATPPVPPTLNRVGESAPPPTLPLGTLPASRVPLPFEDDLADLLDEPEEPKGAAVRPLPPAADRETGPMASPRPVSPNLDAFFARPAQPAAAPEAEPDGPLSGAEAAPQALQRAAESPQPDPAAPTSAPAPAPAAPSFMGLGHATGFFPPAFSKRDSAAPQESAASAESVTGTRPASEQPAPAANIPPLRRSTFFPASFHAQTAAPRAPVEPKLEMPPMPQKAPAPPAPEATEPDNISQHAREVERGSYSEALDQALKRLQGLGSLVPDQRPGAAAAEAPLPRTDPASREPRTMPSAPSSFEAQVAKPASGLPFGVEAVPPTMSLSSALDEVVSEPAPSSDEAQDAPVEQRQPPQTEPAPQALAVTHGGHPTVRLSDALWSKSAQPQATGTSEGGVAAELATSVTAQPADAALEVSDASSVAKAFGALALGLAQSGAHHHAPSAQALSIAEPAPEPPTQAGLPDTAKSVAPAERFDSAPAPLLQPLPHVLTAHPVPDAGPSAPAAEARPAPGTSRSLEDMVADMLRPMLKQWLEDNMPRIVEKALRAETAAKRS